MSDVIFSGSKNRNPMHAASVTLTFDNADNYLKIPYQTVSVKRRLYKTRNVKGAVRETAGCNGGGKNDG